VVSQSDKLTVSDSPVPDYVQNEVRIIADIIGVPCFVTAFVDDDKTYGLAKTGINRAEVWLNERLFQPGQRLLRLRTICHELGHIKGGGDADIEFECSLDLIAGKLAEYVISH